MEPEATSPEVSKLSFGSFATKKSTSLPSPSYICENVILYPLSILSRATYVSEFFPPLPTPFALLFNILSCQCRCD